MKKCDKNLSRFTYFNKLNITNKANYYNSKLTLVKQKIIYSIRNNAVFVDKILFVASLINFSVMGFAIYSFVNVYANMIFNLNNIFYSIIPTLFVLWVSYYLVKGTYISYQWRVGISDNKIIDNLKKQGKTTEAEIIEIRPNNLHYRYYQGKNKRFEKISSFITNHWDKFQVGDKVAVLYAHNMADCLL